MVTQLVLLMLEIGSQFEQGTRECVVANQVVKKEVKFMKKILCVVVLCVLSAAANANGGLVEGKIEMLQVGKGWTSSGVYVLVKMDTAISSQPSCATDQRLAIDPTTELGKGLYSALLSAKHASSIVEIRGTNNCSDMGSTVESINLVRIK